MILPVPVKLPPAPDSATDDAPQSTIPTIPLAQLSSPTNTAKQRTKLLASLRAALLDTGFLYLTDLDHHLPLSLTSRLAALLSRIFLDLTPEQKATAALINTPHFLGYSSFGSETTAGGKDWREQFELSGDEFVPGDVVTGHDGQTAGETATQSEETGRPLYARLRGPNQYPDFDGREEMRAVVGEYIHAVQNIAAEFLELVNEALGLEAGVLEGFAGGGQDRLKLVHYRIGDERPVSTHENGIADTNGHTHGMLANGNSIATTTTITNGTTSTSEKYIQGVGPHKDSSGWLTFLLQASPSTRGLQALSKSGAWLDIPPLEGSLVVNMGQAFEAATNGVCKATTHRVLLPAGGAGQKQSSRFSVPFFMGVRPSLTKGELKGLWEHFDEKRWETRESEEGMRVDSPFLRGKGYECWGEAQLRTKIRSHRDVGKRWYGNVYSKYIAEA
jgi:isopenicillin N synthase-like dioxygenase